MDTTSPPSGVSPKLIQKAVDSLLKWRAAKSKSQKPQLLELDEFVYLLLTLKKIPQKPFSRKSAHKIPLLHPLFGLNDNPELCLIIDDRPKAGLNKDAAKKKIDSDGIPISKIIKLSKLKTDYRPFEAKRKLCDSYDMFLADKRVIPLLPKLLGKHFEKKKKIPVGIDLKHKNWKEQIENACGSALLCVRNGTSCSVKVGKLSMDRESIVSNVGAAINGIAEIAPRKWGGIRSFHLKLFESLALPLYQAVPDLKLRIETNKEEKEVDKTEVQEEKVGKKKRGRIHEVRYMDNTANLIHKLDEEKLEAANNNNNNNDSYDEALDDDHDDNGENNNDKTEGKKRKKGGRGKDEKKEKKVDRLKSEEGTKSEKRKANVKNEDILKEKKQKRVGKLK